MTIVVNGEAHDCDDNLSLGALLVSLEASPERVATLVNDRVIAREARGKLLLQAGDRVEVLVFAGGG